MSTVLSGFRKYKEYQKSGNSVDSIYLFIYVTFHGCTILLWSIKHSSTFTLSYLSFAWYYQFSFFKFVSFLISSLKKNVRAVLYTYLFVYVMTLA